MKRILLTVALFSSVVMSAQTVIVDEKIDEKTKPIDFRYLPNLQKFVVFKGEKLPKISYLITTNAFSYNVNGNKFVFFENQKLSGCSFSITENTFRAVDAEHSSWTPDYLFILNDKSQIVTKDKFEDINFSYFGIYDYNNVSVASSRLATRDFRGSFNDFCVFGFTNQKKNWRLDFEKDDIYFEIIEIKTNTKKRVKLDKPDLTLLKGDSFAKSDSPLNFTCKLNGNKNFDLITKSVSKDFQTTVLYKTTYDFEGKKLRALSFTLQLDNKFFIVSDNGGGPKDYSSSPSMQGGSFTNESVGLDALSINNYFEDRKNGDVYVYGIFSDKLTKKIDANCSPKGFYVFKFDKDGNKIWESVNYIDGKEFFEKIKESAKLQVNLLEYNKDLLFSVSVNAFTEFTNAVIIDKMNGSVSKTSFIEYNNNLSHRRDDVFISNTYDYKNLKNKTFSPISFAAVSINPNVMTYLKSVPEGGIRLYFETIFSDQGIWLVETDNEKYYKVLLFKE